MKKFGYFATVLGISGCATLSPIEQDMRNAILVDVYERDPMIAFEFDTDGDGIGDHKYVYRMSRNSTLFENRIRAYVKELVCCMVDSDRDGVYEDDEIFCKETEEDELEGETLI